MKNYRYGFFVGGAIVFFVAIILEVICVFYKLYKQPTRIHHIMFGVYALGSILLWIAAVMEIELAHVAPALWIVGGVVVMIGQMYFCNDCITSVCHCKRNIRNRLHCKWNDCHKSLRT